MSDTIIRDEVTTARWKAVIHFRTENGLLDVEHGIEEIFELHDIIERGPDWNTIDHIVITLDRVNTPGLTVERSSGL